MPGRTRISYCLIDREGRFLLTRVLGPRMLPISSCLDIEHDISSKDNVIVKHMITGMVKNGLTILSLLLFLLIFLLESSTTLQ